MHQSPLKISIEFIQLSENKHKVLDKLQYLFTLLVGQSNRNSYRQMNHKCFLQMVHKLQNMHNNPQKLEKGKGQEKNMQNENSIDMVFYSKGKQPLTFAQFLKILPNMAVLLSGRQDVEEAVRLLLKDLLKLYQLQVEQVYKGKLIHFQTSLAKETLEYIERLKHPFYVVYKHYFSHLSNNNLKTDESLYESIKKVFEFLKDYEIAPRLMPAWKVLQVEQENLKLIFQHNKSDYGIDKFVLTLVVIANNIYGKLQRNQSEKIPQSQKEELKRLLEYIQIVNINKTKNTKVADKLSFLLYEPVKTTKGLDRNSSFLQILKNIQF